VSGGDDNYLIGVYVENLSANQAEGVFVDINLYQGLLMDESSLTTITISALTTLATRRQYVWYIGTMAGKIESKMHDLKVRGFQVLLNKDADRTLLHSQLNILTGKK